MYFKFLNVVMVRLVRGSGKIQIVSLFLRTAFATFLLRIHAHEVKALLVIKLQPFAGVLANRLFIIGRNQEPISFTVDHPFAFYIRQTNGNTLFAGRVISI